MLIEDAERKSRAWKRVHEFLLKLHVDTSDIQSISFHYDARRRVNHVSVYIQSPKSNRILITMILENFEMKEFQ